MTLSTLCTGHRTELYPVPLIVRVSIFSATSTLIHVGRHSGIDRMQSSGCLRRRSSIAFSQEQWSYEMRGSSGRSDSWNLPLIGTTPCRTDSSDSRRGYPSDAGRRRWLHKSSWNSAYHVALKRKRPSDFDPVRADSPATGRKSRRRFARKNFKSSSGRPAGIAYSEMGQFRSEGSRGRVDSVGRDVASRRRCQ